MPASSAAPCASTVNREATVGPARHLQRRRHLGGSTCSGLGLDTQTSADRRTTPLQLIGRRSSTISHVEGERVIASFGARLATAFPEANAGSTWRTVSLNSTASMAR